MFIDGLTDTKFKGQLNILYLTEKNTVTELYK